MLRQSNRSLALSACLLLVPVTCFAQPAPQTASATASDDKELSDWLALLLAAHAGGGFSADSPRQPTAQAGVKIGMPVAFGRWYPGKALRTCTVDLGYDRIQSGSGFSAEWSVMLPVVRFPKSRGNDNKNYLRIYAEPGAGYRAGGEAFGAYGSAKVMIALLSDKRLTASAAPPSPFVEIQRRFPFGSPLRGDTRVVIGLMAAVCNHCGLD